MAPRNAISKLPPALRDKVSQLLYEGGLTQAQIQAAVREEAIRIGRSAHSQVRLLHTSFAAWKKSPDYLAYVEFARGWKDKSQKRRWAATRLNDGRGPQSMADIAEMEILEQLHDLAQGGLLETGKDVATVARAITSMQRTQLARKQAEQDHRITAIEEEHTQAIAALEATIAQLRDALEEKTGNRELDLSKVADEMDRILE